MWRIYVAHNLNVTVAGLWYVFVGGQGCINSRTELVYLMPFTSIYRTASVCFQEPLDVFKEGCGIEKNRP